MNALQIFNFQGNEVRTVTDENNNIWWVAKDVAEILGYSNTKDAIQRHCKGVVKRYPLLTAGGVQEVRIINEGDLYRLIVSSKLPNAIEFERVVFEEILPSIRKHGAYIEQEKLIEMLTKPESIMEILTQLKKEQDLNRRLMHTDKTYTATELAKELGYRNPADFNKRLEEDKIQYKRNGTWVPYSEYTEAEYLVHKQDTKGFYYTRWTQKGREFILRKYDNSTAIA